MTGYIVFAHGSSVESANQAVRVVTEKAAKQGGWSLYAAAFLEGGRPGLADATKDVLARGASRIVVIPYFLTLGLHLERDLPALVAAIQSQHPQLEIEVTPPLDGHPALLDALVDRANQSVCKRD